MVQEDFLPCGGILDNKKHIAGHVFSGSFVFNLIFYFYFKCSILIFKQERKIAYIHRIFNEIKISIITTKFLTRKNKYGTTSAIYTTTCL